MINTNNIKNGGKKEKNTIYTISKFLFLGVCIDEFVVFDKKKSHYCFRQKKKRTS